MATGGYKCVQFQWTGGRTDTVLERLNYVLTGIVEAIVNSGTGWALDTAEMGQTSSSWYHELTMSSSNKAIVKFLVNSTAGIRLALGYTSNGGVPTTTIPNSDRFKNASTSYYNINGLFASACSTVSTFGTNTGTVSLDSEATKWISTYLSSSAPAGNGSFVYENSYTYTYNMIIKGGQIAFLYRSSNWTAGLYRGFAIGNLFGTLAHSDDSNEYNKLCCILLCAATSGEYNSPSTNLINTENSYYSLDNNICFCRYYDGEEWDPDNVATASYIDAANTLVKAEISNTVQLGTDIAAPEAGTGGRWCPLFAYISSQDPSLYGVVSGDGFKGYFDTDFIRGVTKGTYSRGQTFGTNQEFIYLGGGIAIGWDSTNTISLF